MALSRMVFAIMQGTQMKQSSKALLVGLVATLIACSEPPPETKPAVETSPAEPPAAAVEPSVIQPAPVLHETVEYAVVSGSPRSGYLAYPETAHGGLPGILLFHEWWGLTDEIRQVADALAAQGYVVLALDFHDGMVATDSVKAGELMREALADESSVNDHLRQAYKFITEDIGALSVASYGFGMGGTLALNLALLYPDELDACVVYYGFIGSVTPAQLAGSSAAMLVFFGADDETLTAAARDQLQAALAMAPGGAELVIYPETGHGFANPGDARYSAEMADAALTASLIFLDRTLNAAVNRNVIDEQPEDDLPAQPDATGR